MAVGRLVLSLACGSLMGGSVEFMAHHFSPELVRITKALCEGTWFSVQQLTPLLADRIMDEVGGASLWCSWGL